MVVGTPLAYAALLLFHPIPHAGPVLHGLDHAHTAWLVVHVAQLAFIGAMGAVILLLVHDLHGRAPAAARGFALVFVLLYGAYEAWTGIATAALARTAATLPADDQHAAEVLVQAHWESPLLGNGSLGAVLGSAAWLGATVAAALALRGAGASRRAVFALIGAGLLFAPTHVPPFGPAAMGLFALAALWARTTGRTNDRRRPPAGRLQLLSSKTV
jgi:hypothetical protein